MKDCLKNIKRSLDVRQAKRIGVNGEWRGFVRENTIVVSCYGGMKPLNGGSRSWSSLQLKGINGKIFFVLLELSSTVGLFMA